MIHSKRLTICLLFCMFLLQCLTVKAEKQPDYYSKWLHVPSEELIMMGTRYAELDGKPDSALVCFTIVTGRNKRSMTEKETRYLMQAFIGRWYVYFFCYFDYSQAYENLSRAQELAESMERGMGRVLLNFGCMYQTISEQSGDLKPDSLALDYYKRSYWQSRAENDTASWRMAVSNMITVAHSLKMLSGINRELENYRSLGTPQPNDSYNLLMFEGFSALEKGQYDKAEASFMRQKTLLTDNIGNIRYSFAIYANLSRVYAAKGDYEKALDILSKSDSLVNVLDMKDARLELYNLMADYNDKLNRKKQAEEYRTQYFRLKDSLLNYHQVASVGELRFLGEMKKVDKQIQEMEHHRRVQNMVIATIAAITLVILLSMLIVWRKNRLLRQRNESLYLKNVEMLKKEEEERQRRHELERLVEMQNAPQPKYKGSSLDEEAKRRILSDIVGVMETSQEIFSSDFSAQRLAALVGEKYNNVSLVINERYGTNFNALLNEYRIQEACKRMNDPKHFGHLTIEGIANGVGFKSRTSFIQAFKKYTGLTPSEYQRLAKENSAK